MLFSAVILDLLMSQVGPPTRRLTVVLLILGALVMFWRYSPLIYGTSISESLCHSLKIQKGWHFDCTLWKSSPGDGAGKFILPEAIKNAEDVMKTTLPQPTAAVSL
jgi:hypothetical protein